MRIRLMAAVGWTAMILAACWSPRRVVEQVGEETGFLGIPHFDKLVHLGIFLVFTILWLAASRRPRHAAVAIAGAALAVATELGQLVPWVNREAAVDDAVVDLIGVVVGAGMFRLAAARFFSKNEAASEPVATGPEAA